MLIWFTWCFLFAFLVTWPIKQPRNTETERVRQKGKYGGNSLRSHHQLSVTLIFYTFQLWISFCWCQSVEGYTTSHLWKGNSVKQKVLVKWTTNKCERRDPHASVWADTFTSSPRLHTYTLKSSTESNTYSFLSPVQYITNDSSTPPTPLCYPEGWRNLPDWYRSSLHLSHHTIWQQASEQKN